ncbi:Uncharacterised protein [Mycobacteroides abscessus subsp. abscessus]|nr:Uncharacterised protein [Mycobacteroides abscessus subsp. abscessus]
MRAMTDLTASHEGVWSGFTAADVWMSMRVRLGPGDISPQPAGNSPGFTMAGSLTTRYQAWHWSAH